MDTLTIELPPQPTQTEANLRHWVEVLNNPELSKIEGRIETDRHGHLIMSPLPSATHGRFQSRIAYLLQTFLPKGETLTECPISTADGVRAADVAWASPHCMRELGNRACFPRAPEICVEVASPGNSVREIKEKMALYFNAGASEVWICAQTGAIQFFDKNIAPLGKSRLCPRFPKRIKLR